MQEIRFHGRGGQGVVKSAQILVQTIVEQGKYAHFIPFFGVERKGSPVYGFSRIDEKPIRFKTQVYEPDCLIIYDDTLLDIVPVFAGLKGNGAVIINTQKSIKEFNFPKSVKTVGIINATEIALKHLGIGIPNTAMLGGFAKLTGWVDFHALLKNIQEGFGAANYEAAKIAFDNIKIYHF